VLSHTLLGRVVALFFLIAGVATTVSSAAPLPAGANRLALQVVSAVAIAAGLVGWHVPWERWSPIAVRRTLIPASFALIACANYFSGVDSYPYGLAFAAIFVWIGLSQPRWTSLRFAPLAALAYLGPLLAHHRPTGELLSVTWVLPVVVGLGESCAWLAHRLRTTEEELRAVNAGIEQLLEASTALGRTATEAEVAELTADLAMGLLAADRVQVMVAEEPGSSRFVCRAQRNVDIPMDEVVVDAATEASGTGLAVRTGQTFFVPDTGSSTAISSRLVERIRAASMAFIPLPGEGGYLGAVVAMWSAPRFGLDRSSQRAAEVLSTRAGQTLERARATARLAQDLGERVVAEADLRRERTFLQLLQAVAVAANEARTVEEALQRALDEVCAYMAWPVGHVYVSDEADEAGTLTPTSLWHLDDTEQFLAFKELTERTPLAPGIGLPGRVAVSGRPAWVPDVTTDPNFPRAPAARSVGLAAALGFPVIVDGEVVAVLEFFSPEALEPDEPLLELAAHVGTQLGRVVERRRAEDALRASDERTRAVIETAGDAFIGMNDGGLVTDWNRQAEEIFGWTRQEAMGRTLAELIIPEELRAAHWRGLRRFLDTGEGTILGRRLELRALNRDGGQFPVELTVWATRIGHTHAFSAFIHDISERKHLEDELTRQALHDPLTGLPNRTLLLDRLAHALARSERSRTPVTVLFLDLDRFKTVNDSLGHTAGDRLLASVAERLRAYVRPSDTVARLGGDEFGVLLEDAAADGGAMVAERLAEAIAAPFVLEGRQVFTRASIGIATNTAAGAKAEELLRDADLAMYMAKAQGKGRHAVFESGMHAAVMERLELEADLRRALGSREILLHYQPMVRLGDASLVGLEALVRWSRAGRLVSPAEFIPVAEETGLIHGIGRWVLEEACRQGAAWHLEHPLSPPPRLSVNLSIRQLQDPGLVGDVKRALADSGFEPGCLILEITESMLMDEPEVAIERLRRLKDLGVQLAIDDFGTGYSSLSHLRRFPVDVLKIDRSFVASLLSGPEDAALAHAIVKLGHTLQLRTVAEGIETEEQWSTLRSIGCEYGQGYLFSRPLPTEAVGAVLAEARRGAVLLPSSHPEPSVMPHGAATA
jgi:diguanylate cyclase (GGDEF)-like protein/PAS domain S-box-containing protein